MRMSDMERRFESIEKRLTLLESMFDLKPVEIGKKYEEPKIMPYSQQEEKKDKDEVQNDSLSGDTNLEQGKTINTEQMPVKEDNHPPADNSPQVVTYDETRKVPYEEKVDNIPKKKGRPKKQ